MSRISCRAFWQNNIAFCVGRCAWASELADTLSDREKSTVIFVYISENCNKCFDHTEVNKHKKNIQKTKPIYFFFTLKKCAFHEEFVSI